MLQEESEKVEEEERDAKRSRDEEGEPSEHEEKEQQEAKKLRTEEGEISDEGLSRALRSPSSLSSLSSVEVEAEVDTAFSPLRKSDSVIGNNSNDGRLSSERRPIPRRIETGILSQIPAELLYHILKFLSSEVRRFVLYLHFC